MRMKVVVVGATGIAGQRCSVAIADPWWLDGGELAASQRSGGTPLVSPDSGMRAATGAAALAAINGR